MPDDRIGGKVVLVRQQRGYKCKLILPRAVCSALLRNAFCLPVPSVKPLFTTQLSTSDGLGNSQGCRSQGRRRPWWKKGGDLTGLTCQKRSSFRLCVYSSPRAPTVFIHQKADTERGRDTPPDMWRGWRLPPEGRKRKRRNECKFALRIFFLVSCQDNLLWSFFFWLIRTCITVSRCIIINHSIIHHIISQNVHQFVISFSVEKVNKQLYMSIDIRRRRRAV